MNFQTKNRHRQDGRPAGHEGGRFDVIVVGSSPVSLCMALRHARAGLRVCVLERHDRLGGAWATEDCFGLTGVETSPHIIMPDLRANAILADMFPGVFGDVPFEAQEVFISPKFGLIRLPLRRCLSVAVVRNFVRWIEYGERSWPVRLAMFAAASVYGGLTRWRHNRCSTVYPVAGLVGWFAAVGRALESHGATIRTSTGVTGLEIRTGPGIRANARVILEDGQTLCGARVCVTRALAVDRLTIDGKSVPIAREGRHSQHLTLLVEGGSAGGFWSLYGDDWLEMVNDVTAYVPSTGGTGGSRRVVTARLASRRPYDRANLPGYVARLIEVGYLQPGARVLDHAFRALHQQRMCPATAERIDRLAGGACTILDSGELGLDKAIRRYFAAPPIDRVSVT